MDISSITVNDIVLYLNIFVFALLFIGFLIGLCRGTFKASYWLIVSLVVIVGGFLIFPTLMKALCSYDLSSLLGKVGFTEYQGYKVTTLNDLFEFATKVALGLITNEGGSWTSYTGDIVINQTLVYGLIYGLAEMVLRILFVIILLVLNWTVIRILFGIIYLIVKPRAKRDSRGKKQKKSGLSRLIGGAVGALNALFIVFMACVPLSGIFSIGENVTSFVETTQTEDDGQIVYLSVGGEVIQLANPTIGNFNISDLDEWIGIYRNTFAGKIFSMKIGETAIDNKVFDDMFVIKTNDKEIKIRQEIVSCCKAVESVAGEIIQPFVENNYQFTNEMLDSIDGTKIKAAFDALSELQIIQVVVPVGAEFVSHYVENNPQLSESLPEYVDVTEIVNQVKEIEIDKLIKQIGTVVGSVVDIALDTGYKPSQILGQTDELMSDFLDKLLEVDGEKVEKLFTAIADIQLIDIMNTTVVALLDSTTQGQFDSMLLLKPKLSVSEDGFIMIKDVKTNIPCSDASLLNDMSIELNENGNWVIGGIETTISGKDNQMSLDFSDVKLSDEIKNLGKIYKAFSDLGISSVSGIEAYIKGEESDLDWSNFTDANVTALFNAIFDSKLVSSNKSNVYVIANNFLPNEFRGTLNEVDITGQDLSAVVMAAKILVDSGVLTTTEGEEIDYTTLLNTYGDSIVDQLFKSTMLTSNLTPVINAALTMAVGDKIFEVPEDYAWATSGKDELKKFLKVGGKVLQYKDKLEDFSSFTEEELDDLFNTIADAISNSTLLRSNMNNLINYVNSEELLTGFVLKPLANDSDWTKEEIENILSGVKIILPLLGKDENGNDKDLVTELLKLTEEDIDGLLKSNFLIKNLVCNLYILTQPEDLENGQEKGMLNGIIYLDGMTGEDDPRWFDTLDDDNNVTVKGEIRKLLSNMFKLVKGIESFEDTDALIPIAIKNVSELTNDLGGTDDDIGEILSSVILKRTLVELIKKLPEQTDGLLVVEDDINWYDEGNNPGELRKILGAICDLLVDSEGNVLYDKLTGDDSNEKLAIFVNVADEKINKILDSRIIVDTVKGFIIDYSEGEDSFIYLRNKDMNDAAWSQELKDIIAAAKVLLVEETVDPEDPTKTIKTFNLDKFKDSEPSKLVSILVDIDNDDINTITKSNILVDTIAKMIIDMANEENAVLSIPDTLKGSEETPWTTTAWRSEIANLITSAKALLGDDSSKIDKLLTGSTNELLSIFTDIDEDTIDTIVQSDIIYATLKLQITKLSESSGTSDAIVMMPDDIDEWTKADWTTELKDIINAINILLVEETVDPDDPSKTIKTVNIDKLSGSADELINLIAGLTDDTTVESVVVEGELTKVLKSKILVCTIANQIEKFGEGSDAVLDASSTEGFTLVEWRIEIKKLIKSAKKLLSDEEGNVSMDKINGENINSLLELIVNLTDSELGEILESVILTDTIAKNIKSFGTGTNSALIVSDTVKNYTTEEWRTEINSMIKAARYVICEHEDPDDPTSKYVCDIDKLTQSDNINNLINKIVTLSDNPGEDDDELGDVVGSQIICDTISDQINKQDKAHGGQLVVANDIIWEDSVDGETIQIGELRKIFRALRLLFTEVDPITHEKTVNVDINNLAVNTMLNNIKALNNNPGGNDDDLGQFLASRVLCDTIIDNIIAQSTTHGGELVVNYEASDSRWVDNNESGFVPGELRLLLSSISLLFGSDDIDVENLNVDNILNNIKNLNSNFNGDNDQIGDLIASRVLSDTIISKIEAQDSLIVNVSDDEWNDTITTPGELRNILVSIKLLFGDDPINLDTLNVDSILTNIVSLNSDPFDEDPTVEDELGDLLRSKVLLDTIADKIKTTEALEVDSEIVWADTYNTNNEVTETGELRRLLVSVEMLFGSESVNLDSLDVNTMLNKIINLNNDINAPDDEIGSFLESKVLRDTMIARIKEQNKPTGQLVVANNIVWEDDLTATPATAGELRNILKSLRLLFTEVDPITHEETVNVDINNLAVNTILNNIKDLNNNPNGTNDQLGQFLSSKILCDTIIDNVIAQSTAHGGELVVNYEANDPKWIDSNESGFVPGELRLLLSSISLLFGSDNIDVENLNVDNILNNIKNLNSNFNGDNDQIGDLIASRVLSDTIINKIETQDSLIVNVNDNEWRDTTTTPGELRNVLVSIKLLFGDDPINLNTLNADSILTNIVSLNSDPFDEDPAVEDELGDLLRSKILLDTIVDKIKTTEALEVDSTIVWADTYNLSNEVTETGELRRLLVSVEMLFGSDNVNLDSLDVNTMLNKIINLKNDINAPDDEIGSFLESKVLRDTMIARIEEQNKPTGQLVIANDIVWEDDLTASPATAGELRNILKSLRLLFTEIDPITHEETVNVDINNLAINTILNNIKALNNNPGESDDELGQFLSSKILCDTIIDNVIAQSTDHGGELVVNYEANDSKWVDNTSSGFVPGELRLLLSSISLLFGSEDIDVENLNIDNMLNNIKNLNSNFQGSNDQIGDLIASRVLSDTIISKIEAQDSLIVNVNDNEWRDTTTTPGELRNVLVSIKLLFGDDPINLNTLNADSILTNIVSLNSDPFDEDPTVEDELGDLLRSKVLLDTIVDKIESTNALEIDPTIVWADTYNLNNEVTETGELRRLLVSVEMLFGSDNVNLNSLDVDTMLNKIINLNNDINAPDDEIGSFLESKVLRDTMIARIESQDKTNGGQLVIANDIVWEDDLTATPATAGELRNIFGSIKEIFGGENINMNEFNIDGLTDPSTDLDKIFASRVVLETFYGKLDEIDIIYIKDSMERNALEAKKCVESIKVILGDTKLTEVSSSEINLDSFMELSNEDIDKLVDSQIILYTASKQVKDVLTGASLRDYIELDIKYPASDDSNERVAVTSDEERLEMIAVDLGNLIKTIRDLNDDCGINYNQFGFDTFKEAASTPDKADKVSDTLQQSRLIVHSLSKMMNNTLNSAIDSAEIRAGINCNLTDAEWKTVDGAGVEPKEPTFNSSTAVDGELRKVFRLLGSIEQFTNSASFDITSTKSTLKQVNNSKVLHGCVPLFIDKALASVSSWKYSADDRRELTMSEWDNEIDVLAKVIDLASGTSMNNLDVTSGDMDTASLGKILKCMALSRYLDISTIEGLVKTGVDSTFDGASVTVGSVYATYKPKDDIAGSDIYNIKVAKWNGIDTTIDAISSSTGLIDTQDISNPTDEIDKLMMAISKLRNVSAIDITDSSTSTTNPLEKQGVTNARNIGEFLDACCETTMLENVIDDIVDSLFTGSGMIVEMAKAMVSRPYTTTLVAAAGVLTL